MFPLAETSHGVENVKGMGIPHQPVAKKKVKIHATLKCVSHTAQQPNLLPLLLKRH
jgi:hypothetical protein